jgi:hypothetical protein
MVGILCTYSHRVMLSFQALFYHSTLFYQQVQQTGTIGAMLRFLPTSVSGILCNVLVAWLVNKVNTQWIICTGILSTGSVDLSPRIRSGQH